MVIDEWIDASIDRRTERWMDRCMFDYSSSSSSYLVMLFNHCHCSGISITADEVKEIMAEYDEDNSKYSSR